jgi:tetratricopeptide (TPR) repeat protein
MTAKRTYVFLIASAICALTSEARAWDLLRSRNRAVEQGNAKLKKNDAAGALKDYDRASRELPSNGGVQLDRGLALLSKADLIGARQALLLATEPPAPSEVRANAYYNLGVAFYREAELKAGEKNHAEAQKLFREAVDSFKRSLRLKPANRDAAWNLELAARRINEEQKKEEEKKREEEKKPDPQKPDPQKGDQQKPSDQSKDNEPPKDQQKPDPRKPQDQPSKPQQPQPKPGDQAQDKKPAPDEPKALPADAQQALDALQNGEENLERYKARARAARERRAPEKDW